MPSHTTPAIDPASPARFGDFFRHHGIWAPGVRLFRQLGLRAQALALALTFLLPLLGAQAWLLWLPADQGATGRHPLVAVFAVDAAALIVAGYFLMSFHRVVHGGLQQTRRHLRALAVGDLRTAISPRGSDEIATLLHDLSRLQAALSALVTRVRESSHMIIAVSRAMTEDTSELSARSGHSTAGLETCATAMQQLASMVRQTAQHLEEAAGDALQNAALAEEGGRSMQDVIDGMARVRGASTQITEVIGMMDAIALEANILALNASVEASRAGTGGKAFAALAEEVRRLAQRSVQASREVKGLVDATLEEIQAGSEIVRRAGTTIESIVASSQRVESLLTAISAGAETQSLAIAETDAAVGVLGRSTRQDAARVARTAAGAAKVQGGAARLAEDLQRFKLPA